MLGLKPKRVIVCESVADNGLVIEVIGHFNLEVHFAFRNAYERENRRFNQYRVKLGQCLGIDSSGLGMLLLLHNYSLLDKKSLLISGCSADIKQILHYANFDQLFSIA